MITEKDKYDRVIEILKKSKPVLSNGDEIEKEVINKISKKLQSGFNLSDFIDIMFGWVYVGWVRRSFITASLLLIAVFVYQQGILFKQINYLSKQVVVTDREAVFNNSSELEKKIMIYKLSGRKFSSQDIILTEKELQQLIESVNVLKVKYQNLMNMIDEDPDLKSYIEKKMKENNLKRVNL